MNERDIFERALAWADGEARSQFLDEACAESDELRRHVEGLLQEHGQLDEFLEAPSRPEAFERAGSHAKWSARPQNHPAVEVEVRQIFADAYTTAGEVDQARDHLKKALTLALREYGEKHETVAEIYSALADEVGWNYDVPLDDGEHLEYAERAIHIY